jgi:CRP/FNR family transcriptional regulator, nitrogen oxide reductase regulator
MRTMLDQARLADHSTQTWLYRQGGAAHQFFLVESGSVRLSQLTPDGEDILVRIVQPGEVFGYFTLALHGPNVTSAQVIRPSRLAVWEHDCVLQLLQSIPQAALNVLNLAVRDVAYFYDRTLRLQTHDVGQRVKWALSELVRTIGVSTPEGVLISHGIGQRELAELAGTTIYTVSRELAKFQRQGIVERQRGRITVLQPEKLCESIGSQGDLHPLKLSARNRREVLQRGLIAGS